MSGNTITVTTVRLDSSIPKNTRCAICREDLWFHHSPRPDRNRPSVHFPCTWINKDGEKVYAHVGEIVIAQVFKNTIEGQQVLLVAGDRSHKISGLQYDEANEDSKKNLVNSLMKYIGKSRIGIYLCLSEKLKNLKNQLDRRNTPGRIGSYEALRQFENLDIHEAFAWMRNEPRLEQDIDDEKESIDSSSRPQIDPYLIDPPLSNEDPEQMQFDDSDDDAHVDWDDV